jgi:hypothetical protein
MWILIALTLATLPRFAEAAHLFTVDLFVATDCPIANGYAPEIERLHLAYREKGVAFRLVFPDRDLAEDEVRRHLADYGITAPFMIDRDHALLKRAKATTTPEVVLFDRTGGDGILPPRRAGRGVVGEKTSRHQDRADRVYHRVVIEKPPTTCPNKTGRVSAARAGLGLRGFGNQ